MCFKRNRKLTARFVAEEGCNLILHSRSSGHTDKILSEVRSIGVAACAVAADLNYPNAVQEMLNEIDRMGMDVDIVMNNRITDSLQGRLLSNACGRLSCKFQCENNSSCNDLLSFHASNVRRGSGRILNTTSSISLGVCQAGYSASKAALDIITIDLGSGVQKTNVIINLTDPGWCRTDLGGDQAPNAPESAIPGIDAGVFADDGKSGRYLGTQNFSGMTLADAVAKAERDFDSPY